MHFFKRQLAEITQPIMYIFTGLSFHSHRNEGVKNINLDANQNYFRSEANEGNFIGIVKLMAGENPYLAKHLKNCQYNALNGVRNEPTFLSNSFITSTLFAIRKHLVRTIVNAIKRNGGQYGLLMDGSQDVSTKEQISIVVRYINDGNEIVEHTISFFNAKDTSGRALYERLRTIITDVGLSLENVIGCSFDGASNMRSDFCGVSSFLREDNMYCIYIWCLSHRFNLAVKFATGRSRQIKCILKIAEDSAKMFRSSHIKMNVWVETAKTTPGFNSQIRLKLIGATRWSSKQDAVATIMNKEVNLFVLIKALIRICALRNLDGSSLANAVDNLNSWLDYRNVVSAFLLNKIFATIVPTTKYLQKADLNIVDGIHSLKECHQILKYVEENLSLHIQHAENFIGVTNNLIIKDEEIQSLDCEFKIRTPIETDKLGIIKEIETEFRCFIQTLQEQISDRILKQFEHSESIYKEINFLDQRNTGTYLSANELTSIKKLCEINKVNENIAMSELRQFTSDFSKYQKRQYASIFNNNDFESGNDQCDDEENAKINLLVEDQSDLDETRANLEFVNLHHMQKKKCYCFGCVLKYISVDEERMIKFGSIYSLYKYIATLPSTQVKCERDFSRMKATKIRLRSTLTDKSLENLMVISTGSDLFKNINLDDILDDIIESSSRLSLYMSS